MTKYLYSQKIRIFDYKKFAESLRNEIKASAEKIAKDNGLKIEYLNGKKFRKEDRIRKILEERGCHPGFVHIFSTPETCSAYNPHYNENTGKSYLIPDSGKCLHYYFYFIDEELGLCYICVPTYCPFRLQFYFNGHNRLAAGLKKAGIGFKTLDNAFSNIDNFEQAQEISDSFLIEKLQEKLQSYAELFCPFIRRLGLAYYWTIMQAEYSTDIIFNKREDLQNIYRNIVDTAVLTVKPGNIATFLGRKLDPQYQGEMGNRFSTRIEGTRLKHSMGPASIKIYDKFGFILRIEGTVNDASFFKHYRKVEHRDGTASRKLAHLKKSIYSLNLLCELMSASNHRYLQFISAFEDHSLGIEKLQQVSQTVKEETRSYKGFNFFAEEDLELILAIASGEFNISGFTNKQLRKKLPSKSGSQISRIIKRLHNHSIIKKIGHSYKYYLTTLGLRIITLGLKLKELFVIPTLSVNTL